MMVTVNCSTWPDLKGDADIAGTGVIIGFMLSAYSTLGIVIARYLVDHDNIQSPVDEAFVKFVTSRGLLNVTQKLEKWNKALESAVITFSDTQIITGIAILLCGYIQLPLGISAYHWQVVVALAWFSSLTHLLTLSSLRSYFQKRSKMAVWRAIFMGLIVILLATALGPTGYVSQDYGAVATPAICLFFGKQREQVYVNATSSADQFYGFNFPLIILSIGFLISSYVTKMNGLFPTNFVSFRMLSKHSLGMLNIAFRYAAKPRESCIVDGFCCMVVVSYILLKAFSEILKSMLWELFWMSVALAWGTLRLIGLRIGAKLQEESKWGFGQILPILLSFLPLWSAYEKLIDESTQEHLTSPVAPSQPRPEHDIHLSQFQFGQKKWFSKLKILIFGLALVFAVDLLYNFPLGLANPVGWTTDDINHLDTLEALLLKYIILSSMSGSMVWLFTCVCLAIQLSKPNLSLVLADKVQHTLWICLILSLVVGFFLFDWVCFNVNNAAIFVSWGYNG